MGDMADMALDEVAAQQGLMYDFVSGGMSKQEAFEHGFVDATGGVNDRMGYDEACDEHAENLGLVNREDRGLEYLLPERDTWHASAGGAGIELTEIAKRNLFKESPTCNVCQKEMNSRDGKFGKFYYCSNQCADQGTVSDKYWQSVRQKGETKQQEIERITGEIRELEARLRALTA